MPKPSKEETQPFLSDREYRPGEIPHGEGLTPRGLLLGQGKPALEIVVYDSARKPLRDVIRKIWKERWGGRAISLLVVVLYGDKCALCGHTERAHEAPPFLADLDIGHVERLCTTALDLPDRHSVDRFLREQLPEAESAIFGIRNQGLLATYVIQRGRQEIGTELWNRAARQATKIRSAKDRKLLNSLGYSIEATTGPASILTARGSRLALAIFLDQTESAEIASKRFGGQAPISYALHLAQSHNLKWVIVARESELRLYPTATGIGVGRRGLTDTYLQVNANLLSDDRLAFIWLAFSAEALSVDGLLQNLLEKSNRYAIEIGKRLRDRIYVTVIPELAKAIVNARQLRQPTSDDLQLTYQMAMLVLFRMLFVAYAEDHDLLPYKTNEAYRNRSLTQRTRELKRIREAEKKFDPGASQWDEICLLWRNVRDGNTEWGIPPYDGGLFEEDPERHPAGAALAKIELSNRDFGVILSNLLLDDGTPEGLGPVDFRSLGVREFGTIYEGLLENELSVAETNLTTDKKHNYKPTDDPKKTEVRKDEIYLHTRSGARKATGSYYTKAFAVDHLLDHSLEPALDEHLEKVGKLAQSDPDKAATQLFEFYVADIAMGSGHFLISAIDRIEKHFLNFLTTNPLPEVDKELEKLRVSARKQLGEALDERLLEKNKLLRRLIARRCIYGVDLNPLAVELARLSAWIHTFIPGLPLSFLDHNLVCGNSLVGIGTFEEAVEETVSKGQSLSLFDEPAKRLIGQASDEIRALREISDADIDDIEKAQAAQGRLEKKLAGTRAFFDILTAARLNQDVVDKMRSGAAGMLSDLTNLDTIFAGALHELALKVTSAIPPFHFPIAFPEIFLRDRPGFDVIIGNPPWEEAMADENEFWARQFPGLRGLRSTEYEATLSQKKEERPDLIRLHHDEQESAKLLRDVLRTGPFPGMETGHPDVYKAFCWRFWHLAAESGGRIGVVLPRSAWFAKGSEKFRREVLTNGQIENLTYLLNNRQWIFPEVHPQYTVVLSSICKSKIDLIKAKLSLQGPYRSETAFRTGTASISINFNVDDVLSWTDTASLPLLPSEESAEVFLQIRKAPRLDAEISGWRCRPIQGDLNATFDKPLMTFSEDPPKGFWPVYKGESFDIWNPDKGRYYAWVDPEKICDHLQKKRERGSHNKRSVFSEFPKSWIKEPDTLPCLRPRLAFRDVARATDSRTVIAALVPANIVITNQAPFLLWPSGELKDIAFLVGMLCSIPLDWYARRFVETHVNFHVLNPFPIPRPGRDNILWQRTVELAGRLACPDKRFAEWAKEVGVKYGPLPEDQKEDMIRELDAIVAYLYGLKEKQLRHIFETFHEGWDYEPRMKATMKHFREWKKRLS